MLPRLFPTPWFYAVVRMDPFTMVKNLGLDDPETLAAVEEFHPKKYLVYVDFPLDLPMPNSKWCRYCIKLIGTTLRPEDKKRRFLSDMVIPIFPNTQYSGPDRPPIRPQTPFPFPNCFHWIYTLTNVRMRRPTAVFVDDSHAIRLSLDEHHEHKCTFEQDFDRMDELAMADASEEDDTPSIAAPPEAQSLPAVPAWAFSDPAIRKACCPFDPSQFPPLLPAARQSTLQQPRAITPSLDSSVSSQGTEDTTNSSYSSPLDDGDIEESKCAAEDAADVPSSVADIFALNIFGWDPDPTFPLVPLVDLWFELDEHLTAETIPSPIEWFKEEEKIVSLISDAFERKKLKLANNTLTREPSVNGDMIVDDEVSPVAESSDSIQGEDIELPMQVLGTQKGNPNLSDSQQTSARWLDVIENIGAALRRVFQRSARALCFRCPNEH